MTDTKILEAHFADSRARLAVEAKTRCLHQ